MTTDRTIGYASTDDELFREQMRSSAHGDGAEPRTFAYLLSRAAENRTWELLGFGSFRAFLEAPERDGGLGMDEERLLHIASLAGNVDLARSLLDGDRLAKHGEIGGGHTRDDNIISGRGGTSESYLRRRLKRDRPDLYEQVSQGLMKANAAAVEAGWQSRKLSVAIHQPESVARSLRKHMTTGELAELRRLLDAEG